MRFFGRQTFVTNVLYVKNRWKILIGVNFRQQPPLRNINEKSIFIVVIIHCKCMQQLRGSQIVSYRIVLYCTVYCNFLCYFLFGEWQKGRYFRMLAQLKRETTTHFPQKQEITRTFILQFANMTQIILLLVAYALAIYIYIEKRKCTQPYKCIF